MSGNTFPDSWDAIYNVDGLVNIDVLEEGNAIFPTEPVQSWYPASQIVPSYAYRQYSTDENIQALFAAWNALAQSYLTWFISTPLSVYTNANVVGLLLDWCAVGIYGIYRPVISTLTTSFVAGVNSASVNVVAVNGNQFSRSGTAVLASDDIYKRVLTWWLYRGDGPQMTTEWIKRRVNRFLNGVNGGDVSYPTSANPSVVWSATTIITGALNSIPVNTMAVNGSALVNSDVGKTHAVITVPAGATASIMQILIANGVLALPFQYNFSVTLS